MAGTQGWLSAAETDPRLPLSGVWFCQRGWGWGCLCSSQAVTCARVLGVLSVFLQLLRPSARAETYTGVPACGEVGRGWCKPPRVLGFSKGDLPSFSSVDPELVKLPAFPWHHSGINSGLLVPFAPGTGPCQGIFLQIPESKLPAYLLKSLPVLHLSDRLSRNYLAPPCYDRKGPLIPTNGPYKVSVLLLLPCLLHPVGDTQVQWRSSRVHPEPCAGYFKVFGCRREGKVSMELPVISRIICFMIFVLQWLKIYWGSQDRQQRHG